MGWGREKAIHYDWVTTKNDQTFFLLWRTWMFVWRRLTPWNMRAAVVTMKLFFLAQLKAGYFDPPTPPSALDGLRDMYESSSGSEVPPTELDTPARRSVSEVNTPTVEKEKLETTDSDKKSDQVTAFDETAVEEKAEPDLFEDGMIEQSTLTHNHLPVRKNTDTSNIVFFPPLFC